MLVFFLEEKNIEFLEWFSKITSPLLKCNGALHHMKMFNENTALPK